MNKYDKKLNGQFFTISSPFKHDLFFKWWKLLGDISEDIFIEPFAGSNNIIKMIQELNVNQPKSWLAYDIEPPKYNSVPEVIVEKRDTFENFPVGYRVGITNPPYLAKNSATRSGMRFPDTEFNDLYKLSLKVMLDNLEYVAAIIPESFITQERFKGRLYGVISLNVKMFEDTDVPVCLALFVPNLQKDFVVYRGDFKIGMYSSLKEELSLLKLSKTNRANWKFNDPNGEIGIKTVDNSIKESIEFTKGENILFSKIKDSSRSLTRVSGSNLSGENLTKFLDICNKLLSEYRNKTQDVFMTSFKNLREDKKYRRRLSFSEAKSIMNKALEILEQKEGEL